MKACAVAMLWILSGMAAQAEEFVFDASEFEKKPYEFGGYLEQKFETLSLRGDSSAYRIAYPGEAPRDWLNRTTTTLELSGKTSWWGFTADARAQASYAADTLLERVSYGALMDGGLRWSAGPALTVDLGKRVQRWGKGYAWNPVGFVERPKDPVDPTASREGFVMAGVEWNRSFAGPVSALGLTGLVVPTNDNLNNDFGKQQNPNPAAKLYLLAWDTDVDLMWRGEGARPQSFGADFSRNLSPALEVHGEWAHTLDATRTTVSESGVSSSKQLDYNAYLIGLRYLTLGEITLIGEYYHNGGGYTADELDDYYAFMDRATVQGASASLSSKARTVAQSGYAKANPGQDYLYLKASKAEPFGWLYGSVALTTMANIGDGSWQIQPEVSYTGFSNLELRSRAILLGGPENAEFTTKTSNWRLEAYARWFF